jgi:branched-chain amino acid transport system permease protein
MTEAVGDRSSAEALKTWAIERAPVLLVIAAGVVSLPLVGDLSTWLTLTLAGLAMGMMIFLMASGLSLIFGLMDVLNFGHGAFVTFGAFITVTLVAPLAAWFGADSVLLNVLAMLLVCLAALLLGAVLGLFFERVIVRPVYGDHLRQILVTMGALIVAEELVQAIWGQQPLAVAMPRTFAGAFVLGTVAFEKFRLIAVIVGVLVFAALHLALGRTKIGLLIRAGVENRPMVEALGYRIRALFIGVFVAGSALATFGGVLWAFYKGQIDARIGAETLITVFIVVIIGGLGSVRGSFIGALLAALTYNYVHYLEPRLALASNIILMVLILLWRPTGLYPPTKV